MASSSVEVSKKIRSAIKAKLEELGVYVDEELPDYIMVMIANKKEKGQMKEDLLLFLGKNSGKFVDWLFEIFERLQSASTTSSAGPVSEASSSVPAKKKDSSGAHKKAKKEHEDDKKKEKKKTADSAEKRKDRTSTEKRKEKEREKEVEREREKEERLREKEREAERKEKEAERERKEREKEAERREREREKEAERKKEAERRDREEKRKEAERKDREREAERKRELERLEREVEKEKEAERKEKEELERRQREKEAEMAERRTNQQRTHKPIEYISDESPSRGGRRVEEKRAAASQKGVVRVSSKERVAERKVEQVFEKVDRVGLKRRKDSKQDDDSSTVPTKLRVEERVTVGISPRKRKSSLPESQPEVDSDEEERLAEEEEAMILRSKKVQSSAVIKMSQASAPKTVSSKVIVKRKLPDKENSKESSGAKSLFLKAIKEAGEMTRTASQSAGYGGGATVTSGRAKKSADEARANVGHEAIPDDELDEEEDDLDDALVVMPSVAVGVDSRRVRSVVAVDSAGATGPHRERVEPVVSKRKRITAPGDASEKQNFVVTLTGDGRSSHRVVGKATDVEETDAERPRKRRADVNPILAHLNSASLASRRVKKDRIVGVKEESVLIDESTGGVADSGSVDDVTGNYETGITSETSNDSRRTPVWDGQIQLGEEDSSDEEVDNEAQIDAVLASTNSVIVGYDEVPPTPSLTKPEFFLPQVQAQAALQTGGPRQNMVYSSQNKIVRQTSVPSVSPTSMTPITSEKLKERCKFWPGCRLGENCVYIHPSKPCSNFPNCLYADKCFYVHPTCKFDKACTNPRCPYAHTQKLSPSTVVSTPSSMTEVSSATTSSGPTVPLSVQAPLSSNVPCRFGGKCTNVSCTFKHPKMCRFGERCTNRGCYFRHPPKSQTASSVAPSAGGGGGGGRFKWKKTPSTA